MKNNTENDTGISATKKITRNRKDYAEFLELAVHELDAPLRKLSVMVEKLANKYETGSIEEAQQYLARAQGGLKHMRSLLDALYHLSELDSTEPMNVSCDTNKMVSQILAELQSSSKEKSVSVNHTELPILEGDMRQLRQLFRELLQNAIRFTGEQVEVHVDITCKMLSSDEKKDLNLEEDRNYFKLSIRDNGIGIAKEDLKRIFEPFVRLNGRSEYPGSGIGLTICQKIVDNHHGIIYAEPNENSGSNFLLILPQSLN